MKQIGVTMEGHSEYDDRLWTLLGRFNALDPEIDPSIDYIGMTPYMIMAGATVRRVPAGFVQVVIEVPDDGEEAFYEELERLLGRAMGN